MTMPQLCDGIHCRLTARTGGSAKGEILAVELGKEQTGRVKSAKMISKNKTSQQAANYHGHRTGHTVHHLWAVIY